jgi:hypothetical protein
MAELQTVLRKSLRTGLITESAISDTDYPQDACTESLNFNFDIIGKATLRKGTVQVGQTLDLTPILGLYQFNSKNGLSQFMAVNGTTLYILVGAVWTSKRTGLTAGSKADFTTFNNYVYMVNGTELPATWDGSAAAWSTTVNVTSAPIGKYIEHFNLRVWIMGTTNYPDRLYYSSVPDSTTALITWNTTAGPTGQWLDISPSDGETATSLHRTKNYLLVFKTNHIYQVSDIATSDTDPKIDVGTYSKDSIVDTKNGVYFHHSSGFYQYSNGAIQEISQPIIDIVTGITLENYYKVTGWLETDGNHVCWAVGTVTYLGVTYNNLVVRYTISSGAWTHYVYPSQFVAAANYNDGTNLYVAVGDTTGKIFKTNTGVTDAGTPISYQLIHAVDNIDGYESTRKNINKMYFSHTGAQGTNVAYRVHNVDDTNDWTKQICVLGEHDTGVNNADIKGKKIQFKISGSSVGQPLGYEGYEILSGTTELITFS